MADTLPSAIVNDLVDRLRTALDPIGVMYGPPEMAPESVTCWVRYGPVEFEWGTFEVRHPALSIVTGVKRGGDYPSEYRFVNDTAHLVAAALRGQIYLGDEAVITGVSITEPAETTYAGASIMAATIALTVHTKEINTGA